MNNYNSDGYIMIDLSDVDVTKSTQNVPGIYSRILNVIDANKLILIVNHQGLTPQAAICNKLLNYYVITTNLYIYKINSNDIVIIEQAGSSSVEVSIIPTLMSGTKIADFAIGSVEGELYAPKQESEINDNVTASNSTWSSDKIEGELALKADAADLAEVATTGSYNDLSNKPTIPTKTSDLTNDSGYITVADVPTIDDTTTSTSKVWSSDKTADELALKADATALTSKQDIIDNNLSTTNKTIVGSINELNNEVGISEYNPNKTYNAGEYCYYNGDTYYCNSNSVTGAWDSTMWNSSTVSNDLQNIVIRRKLTEITTSNGNIINHIDVVNGIIVSAYCTSQEAVVTTFVNSQGTHYSFHVVEPTANAPVIASTKVTIEYYMIPRRRIINE